MFVPMPDEKKATHPRGSVSALDTWGAFPGLGAGESNILRGEVIAVGASAHRAQHSREESEAQPAPLHLHPDARWHAGILRRGDGRGFFAGNHQSRVARALRALAHKQAPAVLARSARQSRPLASGPGG